jgi:hypothetical protein
MNRLHGTPYACIACRVQPLPGLGLLLGMLCCCVSLLLILITPDVLTALVLQSFCLGGTFRSLKRGGPGFRPGWTLQLHASGVWWLGEPGARGPRPARMLPGGLHHGRLTVVILQYLDGGRVTALLGPGNLPPRQWRRLRVRLGWPASRRRSS